MWLIQAMGRWSKLGQYNSFTVTFQGQVGKREPFLSLSSHKLQELEADKPRAVWIIYLFIYFGHMKKILWGKEAGKKIWEIEYTTKVAWVLGFGSRGQVHVCLFNPSANGLYEPINFLLSIMVGSLGDSVIWNKKHHDWYIPLMRQWLNKKWRGHYF